MIIPCELCLIRAICKQKHFIELMKCDIIENILYRSQVDSNHVFHLRNRNYYHTLLKIEEVLKPRRWKIKADGNEGQTKYVRFLNEQEEEIGYENIDTL